LGPFFTEGVFPTLSVPPEQRKGSFTAGGGEECLIPLKRKEKRNCGGSRISKERGGKRSSSLPERDVIGVRSLTFGIGHFLWAGGYEKSLTDFKWIIKASQARSKFMTKAFFFHSLFLQEAILIIIFKRTQTPI